MRLTLETLAATERWSHGQVMELEGRCVGSLMKDWAAHVRRRWGEDAEDLVRQHLQEASDLLPPAPTEATRLPVKLQIRTTDIIIEHFLDGDALRLEELLWEDAQRNNASKAGSGVLKLLGPGAVLRHVSTIHQKLYDFGQAQVEVGWGKASLETQGSPVFENPTWRLLQCFGIRLLLRASGRSLSSLKLESGPSRFGLHVRWK